MRAAEDRSIPAARPVFGEADRRRIGAMIDESLATGALTLGPLTRRFEDAVAATVGVPFAIAVSSGTAALEIALRGVGAAGRDVVVPTNTFFATAAAVVHAGATPRFADIDRRTFAVTVETVEAALTARTAAVVVVHIGGLVTPDLEPLRRLCERRGLALIEDAAHAHGAGIGGTPAGSVGQAGTFSFYPTKVVTSAEGGMIVTRDEGLRNEAVVYRDQGKSGFLGGEHVRLGYAWRMSELHAAVGLVQWERLAEFVAARRRVAALYDDALEDVDGVTAVRPPPQCEPNYYKYIVLLDRGIDRELVKRELRQRGVSLSGEVYARPLHREPVFTHVPTGPLPVADDVCARHVCLPVHSDMTVDEAERVSDAVTSTLSRLRR